MIALLNALDHFLSFVYPMFKFHHVVEFMYILHI